MGAKQPGMKLAIHVKVKDARNYTCTPPYVLMPWYLIKQGDSFTYNCILSVNNGV
jgi:hypothetical protein